MIYPVFVKEGALYILGSMTVEALLPPDDYVRSRLGIVVPPTKMWDQLFQELKRSRPSLGHRVPTTCCDMAAVSNVGSGIRFDRQVPADLLASITLGPKAGREQPLKGVSDGQLKNNFSLHGHVRRLSLQSEALFASLNS
jgi:hypothetical protein